MTIRAVVIGAGLDERVAAQLLARNGISVCLIAEGNPNEEYGWIPPPVVRSLDLDAHGLQMTWPDPWAMAPLPAGGRLELWRDLARTIESIRRVSEHDAANWPRFCERMARVAGFLERLYGEPSPDPLSLRFALSARRLGREGLTDLLRLLPMPIADVLDDWFESDVLKGVLAAEGLRHLPQGPRSGGTAFGLLHRHAGSPPGVFSPPRCNAREVLAGLSGIEVRAGEVARIGVHSGRVTSVTLAGGEEMPASLVVSGAHPRTTLLDLVDSGVLDPELSRRLKHIRSRGIAARVTLQLDRAPGFSRLTIAPSLDYLERAHDDAKHGRAAIRPWLEASCDATNRVEVHVQYVPHSTEEGRALEDRVLELLSPHLGGAAVTRRSILLPRDLGPHPAELALDQALWMRPLPELAHHRTPIAGLWLCGPSMHPGAGVLGASGYLCAKEILKDGSAREMLRGR